jgi:hypothetical protein
MSEMITKMMVENGYEQWSYGFAYGVLIATTESYLRGDASRDRLTALVGRLRVEKSAYDAACERGLRTSRALREVAGLTQTLAAGAPPLASAGEQLPAATD